MAYDSIPEVFLCQTILPRPRQEGELKLLKLTNKVRDLLQITKLYTVFDISDDEASAVKSFNQSSAAVA